MSKKKYKKITKSITVLSTSSWYTRLSPVYSTAWISCHMLCNIMTIHFKYLEKHYRFKGRTMLHGSIIKSGELERFLRWMMVTHKWPVNLFLWYMVTKKHFQLSKNDQVQIPVRKSASKLTLLELASVTICSFNITDKQGWNFWDIYFCKRKCLFIIIYIKKWLLH